MSRILKGTQMLGIALLAIGLAYILGVEAGDYIQEQKHTELRSKGISQTRQILAQMGTVEVGKKLHDEAMEDIDGNLYFLSEIVTDKSLISFIKPDCDACLVELDHLSQTARDSSDYKNVILISSANPIHLQELRSNFNLGCYILYDQEGAVARALKIAVYPLNIIVNGDLEILQIYASVLYPKDYKEIFR